jgi:hypothetical protein
MRWHMRWQANLQHTHTTQAHESHTHAVANAGAPERPNGPPSYRRQTAQQRLRVSPLTDLTARRPVGTRQ